MLLTEKNYIKYFCWLVYYISIPNFNAKLKVNRVLFLKQRRRLLSSWSFFINAFAFTLIFTYTSAYDAKKD